MHIGPALEVAGISGHVGWHTLRHTFGTLMKANGEDIKPIQELLRHANYGVTVDVYTEALTTTKRSAQSRVVRMILKKRATKKSGLIVGVRALSNPFKPSCDKANFSKAFGLLAHPTGFEPVLPP